MSTKNNNNTSESILGIVVGFAILFYFFQAQWLLGVSIIVGLLGLFSKTVAGWIHWGWMRLVGFIGYINSHLLLGIIFFIILFPIAMLYRLVNRKDTLQLKRSSDSSYTERNHAYTPKDLENLW